MLALSLHQPYASCIAIGAKKVETRHWKTSKRGLIAIHAALKWGPKERLTLAEFSIDLALPLPAPEDIPLGYIVCVAKLVDCYMMGTFPTRAAGHAPPGSLEQQMGHWAEDRYAWVFEDVRVLEKPWAIPGRQMLWTLSEENEAGVMARLGDGARALPW